MYECDILEKRGGAETTDWGAVCCMGEEEGERIEGSVLWWDCEIGHKCWVLFKVGFSGTMRLVWELFKYTFARSAKT